MTKKELTVSQKVVNTMTVFLMAGAGIGGLVFVGFVTRMFREIFMFGYSIFGWG